MLWKELIIRMVSCAISILGILIMSILMGFVVDAISFQMEQLRKGKSKVAEVNHALILGWSEKIITVIRELCAACETMPDGSEGSCVVILSDTLEKEEMEEILNERILEADRLKTR